MIWEKFLGGNCDEKAYSVQETLDKGYIIAGFSCSDSGDVTSDSYKAYYCEDYWIVKLDYNGNILWQKSFGGSGIDIAYSVDQTTDGGYVVAGSSTSIDGPPSYEQKAHDYYVVKLDASGDLIWERSYGGFWTDEPREIWETPDKGYIVVGYSDSTDGDVAPDHIRGDDWIIKLDRDGDIIWQNTSIERNEYPDSSLEETEDGMKNLWILKRDINANLVWRPVAGHPDSDASSPVLDMIFREYVKALPKAPSERNDIRYHHLDIDIFLVHLDTKGMMIWEYFLDPGGFESARDFIKTSCNEIMIVGDSLSMDRTLPGHHGGGDYYIAKIGVIQSFPGNGNVPCDLDGDGFYEDVNGDGIFTLDDLFLFMSTIDWISRNQPAACFDFNGDHQITLSDTAIPYIKQIQRILSA